MSLRIKWVGRLDTIQRFFRLWRITWERGAVGDGNGYSAKLTFALWWLPFCLPFRADLMSASGTIRANWKSDFMHTVNWSWDAGRHGADMDRITITVNAHLTTYIEVKP